MTNANASHEPTSTLTRAEQVRYNIADHLPTELYKALTTPQVRKMLERLGFSDKKNEVSSDEARAHLLALNREGRIRRTPDGKWCGIERSRRPAPATNPQPIRRGDRGHLKFEQFGHFASDHDTPRPPAQPEFRF